MQWGAQQQTALTRVNQWLKQGNSQVFRLFGWAGTGKTTLARHFAGGVNGQVLFAAYTGKASLVLRQKGCEGATTIHSLIYTPAPLSEGTLADFKKTLFDLRQELSDQGKSAVEINSHPRVLHFQNLITQETEKLNTPHFRLNLDSDLQKASLLIIDEVTMVDDPMGLDLMSFGIPILVLGDPGQLPPVGAGGYFTKQEPDILLTEVHRQARDNPLTWLATEIRNKRRPPLGTYGSSQVIPKKELRERTSDIADASIVLVGTNKTRTQSNRRLRELQGRTDLYPVAGDQLVCLRNNHDRGLLNGGLWDVQAVDSDCSDESRRYLRLTSQDSPATEDVETLSMIFRGEDPRQADFFTIRGAEWFDYGNALTVHKSQGSQWTDGVVIDESYVFRGSQWNHLYTGVTRFSDRVLLAVP